MLQKSGVFIGKGLISLFLFLQEIGYDSSYPAIDVKAVYIIFALAISRSGRRLFLTKVLLLS